MKQNISRGLKPTRRRPSRALAALIAVVAWAGAWAGPNAYTPVQWTSFVQAAGQSEPIPLQWLPDEEARIAHSLKLPEGVPRPVPFSFASGIEEGVFDNHRKRAIAYFDHLCKSEAGEWVFRTVPEVEGFYFARPQGEEVTSDMMGDRYGPEMPFIQRWFLLMADKLDWQATPFIFPPLHNYRFVEQPRRNVNWQAHLSTPYIRLFGYTSEPQRDDRGKLSGGWRQKTPMQVIGIPQVTARYGYTWRGIKRSQDREHGIAGGELLIYDRTTHEVLAVQRNFLISLGNSRTGEKAAWEVAARCPQLGNRSGTGSLQNFVLKVLKTIEPSREDN